MRRQTNPQGLATRWPVRKMDVDPFHLPTQFSLPVQTVAGQLLRARDRIRIENATVAVEREVMGTRATTKEIALEEFTGVAIRADLVGEADDRFAVSVNLHHPDPDLCIPLHMSYDMCEVSARWQSWARALRLPLLLPALDGTWKEPVERLGKVSVKPPHGRVERRFLAKRRSCMSALRETGDSRARPAIGGAEIIARQ